MIDFVIGDDRLKTHVFDIGAYRGVGVDIDYFLVISQFGGLLRCGGIECKSLLMC